ncbi:MAG: DMT family transporter [Clostridia bacterium]|nr:DMT family transporter [Clostridia bacterium]
MSVNKQRVTAFWSRFRQRFSTLNWVTALWSVALFFLFPVVAVFKFTDIPLYDAEYFILNAMEGQLYFASVLSIFIAPITTNAFNYLNSRTQLDFYHSQPVTRKELFFTNYFAGWLSFAAPLTTAFLLEAIVIFAFNGFLTEPLLSLAWGYGGCMGVYFAVNAIFTLAVMLCGTRITSLVTGAFLCVAPMFTVYMIQDLFMSMSETRVRAPALVSAEASAAVTPFVFIYDTVSYSYDIIGFRVPDKMLDNLWIRGIWLLISAALVITALWLYTRRKSEDAEKAFVFPRIIPFLRYPAVVLFAWLGGFLFNEMATSRFWYAFGIVVSGVFAFFLSEIIIKKSFAGAFRAWKKILICAAAYVGCMLVIYAGALLFDVRTAKDESITAIDVKRLVYGEYTLNGDYYEYPDTVQPFRVTDGASVKALNKMIRICAKNSIGDKIHVGGVDESEPSYTGAFLSVNVVVHTRSDSFERRYFLQCNANGDIENALRSFVYGGESVKAKQLELFSALDHSQEYFALDKAYQRDVVNRIFQGKDAEALYQALKTDIEDSLPSDYKKSPVGTVTFDYSRCFHDYPCGNSDPDSHAGYYMDIPIYPSYENVLNLFGRSFTPVDTKKEIMGYFSQKSFDGSNTEQGYNLGFEIGRYFGERDRKNGKEYDESKLYVRGIGGFHVGYTKGLKEGYKDGYN